MSCDATTVRCEMSGTDILRDATTIRYEMSDTDILRDATTIRYEMSGTDILRDAATIRYEISDTDILRDATPSMPCTFTVSPPIPTRLFGCPNCTNWHANHPGVTNMEL
eukprot:3715280-Rhodomonas_salina.2